MYCWFEDFSEVLIGGDCEQVITHNWVFLFVVPQLLLLLMKNSKNQEYGALFSKTHISPQWQGFIYEHDGTIGCFVRHHEQPVLTQSSAPVSNLQNTIELHKHHRVSQPREAEPFPQLIRKPIQNKTATAEQKPSKPVNRSTQKRRIPISKIPVKKPIAFSSRKPLPNLFPRVPIIRVEEKGLTYGPVVYRGMIPRTSDRFFNTLKEVDYAGAIAQGHNQDRLKQPLTFNSKFQCGNLNYAVRALKSLKRI